MKRLVLADTGPLYAALDPDDQHHRRAQDEIGQLNEARLGIALLYPTLLEAYSLSLHRLGPAVARRWLGQVADRALLLSPTAEDYLEARRTVDAFADQPLTLFDAVLAAVCRRLAVPLWTFDHHFDVMCVEVWRE